MGSDSTCLLLDPLLHEIRAHNIKIIDCVPGFDQVYLRLQFESLPHLYATDDAFVARKFGFERDVLDVNIKTITKTIVIHSLCAKHYLLIHRGLGSADSDETEVEKEPEITRDFSNSLLLLVILSTTLVLSQLWSLMGR